MSDRRFYRGPEYEEDFDDDAQVDGDASGAVSFDPSGAGTPWLRTGIPPWHMWGNQTSISLQAYTSDEPLRFAPGQVTKVAYKRPTTWHWLFAARIIDAPTLIAGNDATITINFDVISGIGRSNTQMLTFDSFQWTWADAVNPAPPPLSHVIWANQTMSPAKGFILQTGVWVPNPATQTPIVEVVGQDIQVTVRADLYMRGINEGERTTATVEVGAFWAPKTHIRPDWFINGPAEVLFGGDEVAGR